MFHFICLALQINRRFPLTEVQHLINARTQLYKTKYHSLDCDSMLTFGKIVSTKLPEHAILSMEAHKIHIFLHDDCNIRRCVWDGDMSFDRKTSVVHNLIQWLNETENSYNYTLMDHEDSCVFYSVLDKA